MSADVGRGKTITAAEAIDLRAAIASSPAWKPEPQSTSIRGGSAGHNDPLPGTDSIGVASGHVGIDLRAAIASNPAWKPEPQSTSIRGGSVGHHDMLPGTDSIGVASGHVGTTADDPGDDNA